MDNKLNSAVRRLSGTPDFQVFLEHINNSLKESDENNRLLEDSKLYRSQGMSLAYVAILRLVEEATKRTQIA